jgi:hypothetical protein
MGWAFKVVLPGGNPGWDEPTSQADSELLISSWSYIS